MKTNILTGGLMMMLAASCNSFLDVVPDNRTLLDSSRCGERNSGIGLSPRSLLPYMRGDE
ncbi:MAG: hypothetical protein ACLU4J_11030 [Butyricimonas paravirosa]